MNTRKKSHIIFKILLFVLFVVSLIMTVLSTCLWQMTSQKAVARELEKNGFYTILEQEFYENTRQLHSIIEVDTPLLVETVDKDELKAVTEQYAHTVAATLLQGADDTFALQVSLDKAKKLFEETFSKEKYGENAVLMEIDRQAALSDFEAVIDKTVQFFPLSLYDKAAQMMEGKLPLQTVYRMMDWVKKLIPLFLTMTLMSGALLVMRSSHRKTGLRQVCGTGFIVTAILFFPVTLLRFGPLLQKLSLADGLLRRFVFALFDTIGKGYLFTALLWFLVFAVLFAASTVFSAISYKNAQG